MNTINNRFLPKHIALIMDGNRRWAKKHNRLIKLGHKAGAETLNSTVDWCIELSIPQLTVFAFSTENWNREEQEVNDIMHLLRKYLDSKHEEFHKKGVKVTILGEPDKIAADILKRIEAIQEETKNNDKLFLNIAFNYGGRKEIVSAAKKLAKKVLTGILSIQDINEELFSNHLYNINMIDPDLIIRTGGEYRISNFLLWQLAYSELYFTDTLWPDFSKEDLTKAIINFQNRERRYGKGTNQKNSK
jgi:undecaprenyl diphosphate synthase